MIHLRVNGHLSGFNIVRTCWQVINVHISVTRVYTSMRSEVQRARNPSKGQRQVSTKGGRIAWVLSILRAIFALDENYVAEEQLPVQKPSGELLPCSFRAAT